VRFRRTAATAIIAGILTAGVSLPAEARSLQAPICKSGQTRVTTAHSIFGLFTFYTHRCR
jgi:hypothetical protein